MHGRVGRISGVLSMCGDALTATSIGPSVGMTHSGDVLMRCLLTAWLNCSGTSMLSLELIIPTLLPKLKS